MNAFRDIRVMPVVVVAICGFAVVKIAGIVLDGGYVFDYNPQSTQRSWAQDNFNFPGGAAKPDTADITGSVDAKKDDKSKDETKDNKPKEDAPKLTAPQAEVPNANLDQLPPQDQPVSPAERAVLERLQSRRQELDARAREMDIRDSLLKAAEKRVESQVQDLKATESRIAAANEQKSEADAARFKGIVTMYENMKPKDAAKVFDRLQMPVLFEIASKIAPRKMSDILGQMSPDVAERLTTEMARHATGDVASTDGDLPKIEGKVMPPQQPQPN
jgi:flagellar motility protein MotE (MotC chaperone)